MNAMTMALPSSISGSLGNLGKLLDKSIWASYELLGKSTALGLSGIEDQILEVAEECSFVGWDGGKAQPVSHIVLTNAIKFMQSLPVGIKAPDVCAGPDGSISFEWYRAPMRDVSINISPDNNVYFAAILGTIQRDGKESGKEITDDMLSLIQKVYS